jgi:hypothetical protein
VLGLGCVALAAGDLAAAEPYLTLAADLAHEADAVLEGRARLAIAELQRARGQQGRRLATLTLAVNCFAKDSVYLQARALSQLATAQEDTGSEGAARATWVRVDDLYADMGLPEEDRIYRQPLRPAR